MPRPGPKPEDLEFEIHVDPSCLSEDPMAADDEVPTKVEEEKKADEVKTEDTEVKEDTPAPEATKEAEEKEEAAAEAATETPSEAPVEAPKTETVEAETEAEPAAEDTPASSEDMTTEDDKPEAEESVEATAQGEPEQSDAKSEEDLAEEVAAELAASEEAQPEESEPTPEPQAEEEKPAQEDPEAEPEKATTPEPEITADELAKEVEEELAAAAAESTPAVVVEEVEDDNTEPAAVREASRSSSSMRRASGQTEALIQAAAKEVLERLEAQTMETIRNRSHSPRDSMGSTNNGTEIHYDTRSDTTRGESHDRRSDVTHRDSWASRSQASYHDSPRESRRESRQSRRGRHSRRDSDVRPAPMHIEDGGDSSSQHGGDSDVFSDRSARSSMGSFDGGHMDHHHKDMEWRSSKRSSAMSDISMSDISHYDREEFVPTIRGSQRMPFRTPSDVKAMQYSSPAPSIVGSPRSAKRGQLPTISRLGSPTVSAQYSPKGRTTPTRLKVKKEPAPLVLLHVTLLPLRWQWAEILENTPSDNLTAEAKNLREAWHHLHDRVAETVCERGILLSHPQDDYEILEERLLEALDLPLRRRARVLECGHYIGPSNESTMTEEIDSDEEEYDEEIRRRNALAKTHWCPTCRHDIRYESLGPGKIFRIKVYASNGLMRTGAWAACWKEMERVDVEIEPIVTSGVLDELERLVIAQSQQMVKHENPTIIESTETDHDDISAFEHDMDDHHLDRSMPALEEPPQEPSIIGESNMIEPNYEDESHIPASSPAPAMEEHRSPSPEPMHRHHESEERRLRDEARMREIYGDSAPPSAEPEHEPVPEPEPQAEEYTQKDYTQTPPPQQSREQPHEHYHQEQEHHHQQSPPPPSSHGFDQQQGQPRTFQNAGFGELLLEAARVFMQDKKNLAIVVMGLLMLFMVVKPAPREVKEWDGKFVEQIRSEVRMDEGSKAAVEPAVMDTVQSVVESVTESIVSAETPVEIVIEPSQAVTEVDEEAEAAEPSQDMPVSEPTATVDEEASETSSASSDEPSPSVIEDVEESELEVEEGAEEPTPSSEPTPSPLDESESQSHVAVHQTITTREVVRIMETVTETVKAFVTETEVVQSEPTASVAPEAETEEQEEGQVEDEEEPVEGAAAEETVVGDEMPAQPTETEEEQAAETVAPAEELVDEAVVEEEPASEEAEQEVEQEQESETAEHDEL
ncbi:Dynein heavy chain-like protein [Colletotrichum sp. SAR11_240]|nr:Dynein heavy chain-like protein [Colletotrichum sp. SAR11_240]